MSKNTDAHLITKNRIMMLFIMIFIALSILIFRLSFLQLTQGQQYVALANNNRYISQPIPAPRGFIYDTNHTLLVTNKPSYVITFQRLSSQIQNPMEIVSRLYPVFKMNPVDLFNKMDPYGEKYTLADTRKIVVNATPSEIAFVKEHQAELPGVNVMIVPVRDYLYGDLAAHVIGYLNDIPQKEYQAHQSDYLSTDKVGWAGVEKQYESYLHGKNGVIQEEVNINYQPLQQQQTLDPIRGDDVQLTIDKHLQEVTQNILATQVQATHNITPSVVNGAAIAMNPKTGAILAMASYPSYDPNMWTQGVTNQEYRDMFEPGEMNRAIQQLYIPGSVIKMSTVLIGLKEGAITPYQTYNDPGFINFGNTTIHSWTSLGDVDAISALEESSNVYMIHVFENLFHYNDNMPPNQVNTFLNQTLPSTMKKVIDYQQEFGLGPQKTGVDLPYEAIGSITQEGYASDLAFTAFGQSENNTLMQLAQYISTLANNGKRMKPYVVSDIYTPQGKDIKTKLQMVNQVNFSQSELDVVHQGMYEVTHGPKGTFSSFATYPIPIAGKSGTAETGRGTENNLFIGYAPYNDPQIAIAVIIPDDHVNSQDTPVLGPIVKSMMDAYFKLDQKSN